MNENCLNSIVSTTDNQLNDQTNSTDSTIKKKKVLGKLKSESTEQIRMNIKQIINLKEMNCGAKEDRNYENERNQQAISIRATSAEEFKTQNPLKSNETNLATLFTDACSNLSSPVAIKATSAVCNCFEQFPSNYLNHQQQFNHSNYRSNRVVSASLIWRTHSNNHSEQKDFARIFISIYILFLVTWLPFVLTIILTQLFTCSIDENLNFLNRTKSNSFHYFNNFTDLDNFKMIRNSSLNFKNLVDHNLDSSNSSNGLDSSIGLDSLNSLNSTNNSNNSNNSNSSKKFNEFSKRRSNETILNQIKELDFKFINQLWFSTLIYSTFSVYLFPIINRRWIAKYIELKMNKFVNFITNH